MTTPSASPQFIPAGFVPTEEQRKIQTSRNRTTLVIANAGAAKTTTLALRIGEALTRGLPPEEILALTFTDEARQVLQTRLQEVGIAYNTARRVKVQTPISRFLRLSLGAMLAQIAAHERRHMDQARRVREMLPSATFVNELDGEHRNLKEPEILQWLSRAHVGLCLSAEEGQNRSTAEYVLSGLPVVSTLSRGGRDQFFDSDFCVTVPPAPQLIADAVRELIKLEIPRQYVRRRTMHKLALHRERLIQAVHRMLASMGCARLPKLDWPWLGDARGLYSVRDFHKALMWD